MKKMDSIHRSGVDFADKLKEATGVPASFWVSLQYIYDKDRGYRHDD